MAIRRTAVILMAFPRGEPLSIDRDQFWYHNYFFGPIYGQAGYWLKQTNGNVVLDGEVFDWVSVNGYGTDLMSRGGALQWAVDVMANDQGVNFDSFQLVLLVLGVGAGVPTWGGSAGARIDGHNLAGVILRPGDSFDFIAHEIGHAIGLNHSYGSPLFQAAWGKPGEYGHPYCIMSAMSYGGLARPYIPKPPRDGRNEYAGLGPSLNAATAVGFGWLDRHVHQLPGEPTHYLLRSRHWLDNSPYLVPQALEVKAPAGKTFVLEYRENEGWDKGQDAPMLIINAGSGSTADLEYPDSHSATYLSGIRIPISFGSPGSIFNGPGFGIEILDRSTDSHSLHIRLHPGSVTYTPIKLIKTKEHVDTTPAEQGTTVFERGDTLCVEGSWPYVKVERTETVTFEATYALAVSPLTVAWSIDDIPLVDPIGVVHLMDKEIQTANPKLHEQLSKHQVNVHYEIVPIPNGSRLQLYNYPYEETYIIAVTATLSTVVGSGTETLWEKFEGLRYQYPDEFYEDRDACMRRLADIGNRYVHYKVVLKPELWTRVLDPMVSEVEQGLKALALLHEQQKTQSYQELSHYLAERIGVTSLKTIIVSYEEKSELSAHIHEHDDNRDTSYFDNTDASGEG